MFDGEEISGYILYDHKTSSVKIPCFKATTISQFGDGFEGNAIYYNVEVEVNGKVGTAVFVNEVDSGKIIGSNGKVKVTVDTSGDDGDKSFSITLKDDKSNESEALAFTISKSKAGYSDFYVKGEYTVYVDPMYNNIEINNNHKTLTQWANELGFEIEDLANNVVYECYNRNQVYPDCTSWGSDETYGYNDGKWEFHKCSYNSWSWDNCYNRPKEIYIKK